MKHRVHILHTGESYLCGEQTNLLAGMETLGRKGIPVGCRNGGCGICKVHIMTGNYEARLMSRAHVSAEEKAQGQVLACRVQPRSELQLQVIGLMRKCLETRR